MLQLDPRAPIDNFGPWLAEVEGLEVRVVETWREGVGDDASDGVVVLGGTMDAYADHAHLQEVGELIRRREAAGAPTLGICLGHQLAAVALGGSVDVGAAAGPEVGVVEVRWHDDAAADPVLGDAVRAGLTEVVADHRDAVSRLPAGARVLAESDRYVQAMRTAATWGLQFHPEVSVELMADWVAEEADGAEVLTGMRAAETRLLALGRSIAHGFGGLVAAGDSPRLEEHR